MCMTGCVCLCPSRWEWDRQEADCILYPALLWIHSFTQSNGSLVCLVCACMFFSSLLLMWTSFLSLSFSFFFFFSLSLSLSFLHYSSLPFSYSSIHSFSQRDDSLHNHSIIHFSILGLVCLHLLSLKFFQSSRIFSQLIKGFSILCHMHRLLDLHFFHCQLKAYTVDFSLSLPSLCPGSIFSHFTLPIRCKFSLFSPLNRVINDSILHLHHWLVIEEQLIIQFFLFIHSALSLFFSYEYLLA